MYGLPPMDILCKTTAILEIKLSDCCLLVHERWDRHDLIVFDHLNIDYKWMEGHNKASIEVLSVIFASECRISPANDGMREQVNSGVARHHNNHGWVPPPYSEDHTAGQFPVYMHSRSISTAEESCETESSKV